ncbi:hypothetical protein BerOc1_01922 [Pseudodesulfovibrio hydrargyri]|uniref:Uncharacterized protein n=1 Tax=Pseudodesulfovibrio hydrargyri TaxID=2125990 RepID=A0A1J5NE61_9BACT|nr:hypothetical protein [Pseudodesulfovibrio hydrargyri]OIQ49993.1 hypothetical protein BerOc1_01922 [Pseudodesulfovibrio hydrargyri]
MVEQIKVELPEPGETATYRLAAGVPVRFAFDLSQADFAASGDDLVITPNGGGTVILAGYLTLAGEDALPVFEMLDGQLVPGGVYLFAFDREFETAADDAPGGSGAGTYADDPGLLGDGLDALDGQSSLFAATATPQAETLSSAPVESEALPAQDGVTIYPETTPVQIVLNPGFEASGYDGDRWSYLDDVNHWQNTGGSGEPDSPPSRGLAFRSLMVASPDGSGSMKTWGTDQNPQEGERLMELDARAGSEDTLSQAIATRAGEDVTIVFNFAPRVGNTPDGAGMETNDFQVSLGDQLVATITWDAAYGDGAWLVTLGEGVTTTGGVTGSFHFTNWGHGEGNDASVADWTELGFTLTANQDHAALTFSELSDHNDGYGTLIDSVTAYRDFDTLTVGGESDDFHRAEFLAGTDGDDAIFGSAHTVVDGLGDTYSYAEVIDGGAGDDALYGGQNFLTVISGGAGDDFIVAGRPLGHGLEESHATDEPVGQSYILPGSGNDYVRLGQGADSIILNREALVDGEKLTVENFTPSNGESLNADHLFLADGLRLQGSSYSDGDLHLLIGDGSNSIEVTLVGMEPAALDTFLHTGSEADTLNDQIQAIIDSGGHLA